MGLWPYGDDTPQPEEPSPETPNGEAKQLEEYLQRIARNEQRLSWLSQRVKRLEEAIAADTIAPIDYVGEDGQSK
jgi:hypothetical protein